MSDFDDQLKQMREGKGFIAALDQSGGSTPKALRDYGILESAYSSEEEMFDLVHQMRSRIMTCPVFNGDRILGAILFEMTMERQVQGQPTSRYLWSKKRIVPFLKVDQGMEKERDGVQLMKEMSRLDDLLQRAKTQEVFGTKMRSVIHTANASGVEAIVAQQFHYARKICSAGFVPIIEPEVDIRSPQKREAEAMLRDALLRHLESLDAEQNVMFKLSLPEEPGFYEQCRIHPNVIRIVALSGGYTRDEANERLAKNHHIIASFSRGLLEGLKSDQSDEEFTATLDRAIESIHQASLT